MNTTSLTKLHHQMVALLERAEKAESELAKLRAAPAVPESNRARAARTVARWPKWKRNWRLTKHSPQAAGVELVEPGGCAPAVFIPDDDTRRNDEAFAAIKPGSAAGIMSPMNACMHRDTCRAMLQSAEVTSG